MGWITTEFDRTRRLLREMLEGGDTFVRRWLRRGVLVVRGFIDDRCLLRAAALAFTTLLSIVPLLAALLLIFKAFGSGAEEQIVIERIREVIARILPQALLVHGGAGLPGAIADALHDFAARMSAGRIGGVGVVFLLVTAVSVLRTAEETINDIWGIRRGRSLIGRFVIYWAILSLGPILFIVAVSTRILSHSQAMVEWVARHVPVEALADFLSSSATSIGIATVMLTLFFLVLPHTRVRLRSALLGGLASGFLLMTAVDLFGYAFAVSGKAAFFRYVYGAIAAVPIIFLFVYIAWAIVLLGAEIAFADQNAETAFEEHRVAKLGMRAKVRAALRLMTILATRFEEDRPPSTLAELRAAVGLPSRLVHELLDALDRGGLLLSVEGEGERFAPAHDPRTMTVRDVVRALEGDGSEIVLPETASGNLLDASLAEADALLAQQRLLKEGQLRSGSAPAV